MIMTKFDLDEKVVVLQYETDLKAMQNYGGKNTNDLVHMWEDMSVKVPYKFLLLLGWDFCCQWAISKAIWCHLSCRGIPQMPLGLIGEK